MMKIFFRNQRGINYIILCDVGGIFICDQNVYYHAYQQQILYSIFPQPIFGFTIFKRFNPIL